jgi:hypothetical protein
VCNYEGKGPVRDALLWPWSFAYKGCLGEGVQVRLGWLVGACASAGRTPLDLACTGHAHGTHGHTWSNCFVLRSVTHTWSHCFVCSPAGAPGPGFSGGLCVEV